jgi:hypothetical protein
MAPALFQALPAMGVCRYIPQSIVHGPISRMGLGIPECIRNIALEEYEAPYNH